MPFDRIPCRPYPSSRPPAELLQEGKLVYRCSVLDLSHGMGGDGPSARALVDD